MASVGGCSAGVRVGACCSWSGLRAYRQCSPVHTLNAQDAAGAVRSAEGAAVGGMSKGVAQAGAAQEKTGKVSACVCM